MVFTFCEKKGMQECTMIFENTCPQKTKTTSKNIINPNHLNQSTLLSTLYTIRNTCKAMCLQHFILYETIRLLVILSLQRNALWCRSDILNVAFIIRLSLLWKFNPYQLVWYQTFVFHFRTNAIPHFSLLKKKMELQCWADWEEGITFVTPSLTVLTHTTTHVLTCIIKRKFLRHNLGYII